MTLNDIKVITILSENIVILIIVTTFAIVDRAQRNKSNQLAKRSIYV